MPAIDASPLPRPRNANAPAHTHEGEIRTPACAQEQADRLAGLSSAEISRRSVLRGLFLGLGAAALPSWILRPLAARAQSGAGTELAIPFGPLGGQDFGPLLAQSVADSLASVNHQLFAPAEFSARVVMRAGVNPLTLDTSGTLGHVNPDGGAVYPTADGGWIYVSNSETTPGGVSALRFDASANLIDYYRICSGTRNNCAGGQTPWGTWITCEEVTGGWAFECDPSGVQPQRRLDALGARNGREAVAIDPRHHAVYQTLDTSAGKFVRFTSDASDLELTPDGVTRMRMLSGTSERLFIPAFGELAGFPNTVVPNTAAASAQLRPARPIQWLPDSDTNGTNFAGGEGIWYYEIPEPLRQIPSAGTVPTRGVIFFASKGDNRLWAIDIENALIELIYDTHNNQAFPNLRNPGGAPSNYSQVDNVVVSPFGDVLVAEDGNAMRIAILFNGQPAKLLMQITRGGSEIAGPAFTPDGSRLYFSSQRGPSGSTGSGTSGVIYELSIPPRFRALQRADAFGFRDRLGAAPGVTVTSESVAIEGFLGPLQLAISAEFDAQFSIDGGEWTALPASIEAGQALRVRHTSSPAIGEARASAVTIGLASGATRTVGTFTTVTSAPSTVPDPFDFGTLEDVPGGEWIESPVLELSGYNLPTAVFVGPHAEYRIDGGAWTTADGSLEYGQTLQLRHVSNGPARSVSESHIRVGGVTGHFRTRTAARS